MRGVRIQETGVRSFASASSSPDFCLLTPDSSKKPMNFPSHFENVLDMAAKTALDVFRLECLYYYEDRKTGQRHPVECIERTIELVETDSSGMTFVRTGKGFLVSRADREAVDAWRSGLNIDVQKEPTPFGGDYIVRCTRELTEWYEITHREPSTVIAPNRALYRINTIFVRKDNGTNQ